MKRILLLSIVCLFIASTTGVCQISKEKNALKEFLCTEDTSGWTNFQRILNDPNITLTDFWQSENNGVILNTQSQIIQLRWQKKGLQGKLNVSGLEALEYLYCNNNQLDSLGVEDLSALTLLDCADNNLNSLKTRGLNRLQYLYCDSNRLSSLYLEDSKNLKVLECYGNVLEDLNITGLKVLEQLYCFNNKLTSLVIEGSNTLKNLQCYNNQMTSLNIMNAGALVNLYCYDNELTSLQLANAKALKVFHCYNNKLDSLNTTGFRALESLYCQNNRLSSLSVDSKVLKDLYCFNNLISILNLKDLRNLKYLYCNKNQLTDQTFLLPENWDYTYFHCYNNHLSDAFIDKLNSHKKEDREYYWYSLRAMYRTIELEVGPGIQCAYTSGELFVDDSYYLYLQFQPENTDITASGISFLVDGKETSFEENNGIFSYMLDPVKKDYGIEIALREDPSSNIQPQKKNYTLFSQSGTLIIETENPQTLQIYNVTGSLTTAKVANAGQTSIPLTSGIYIVRLGNTVQKVVVF